MAELSTAAPYGDTREIDAASMKRNHILRASVSPALYTFRKGALVGIRPGSVRLIEQVLDGTPRSDLEIVGVYDDERGQIDPITDAGSDGEALDAYGKSIRVSVRDGDLGNFDTAAPGANQILPEHVGLPCFAKNDNTLWLTDDGGTLSFAGLVGAVNARGKVTLRNTWDLRQQWKNFGTAFTITAADVPIVDGGGFYAATNAETALQEVRSDLAAVTAGNGASLVGVEDAGALYTATNVEDALAEVKTIADAALPAATIQSGTDTLAAGTVVVVATITANSRIVVTLKDSGAGAITGFADLETPTASRVVGAPGSFTVNAIDDAKALIATAVCTFDWIVIG